MQKNIIISDRENLEKKKQEIKKQGIQNLHVVSDFDRTLTRGIIKGKSAGTVIAQLREGHYLTPDYSPRAFELADIYYPIEISQEIPRDEKDKKMHEWWRKHFDLLIECGLDKKVIEQVVREMPLQFRPGALDFLALLHQQKIPLVIMSAGPGDIIAQYLRKQEVLYDNIHIVANFFVFDENGKVIGVKEPIIHSLNKHETETKALPLYRELKKRKNVLLLGDSLEDLGMIEGFPYKTLIKIGFLNKDVEKNIELYKEDFDVVILNDVEMDYVNELIEELKELSNS